MIISRTEIQEIFSPISYVLFSNLDVENCTMMEIELFYYVHNFQKNIGQ